MATYAKLLGFGVLMTALALTGCGKADSTSAPPPKGGGKEEPHAHGKGPNGGVVFDLGKYHAEFTVDHPKKSCQILVIDSDKKDAKPLPVKSEEFTLSLKESKTKEGTVVPAMTIKMVATDAKDGKAATFVGTDPGLGNVADFEGTVSGLIDGKPSPGEFTEK